MSWLSGGLCILLGVLFLVIHFLVVSRTSSLQYFQTIPAYIPAIVVGVYQKIYISAIVEGLYQKIYISVIVEGLYHAYIPAVVVGLYQNTYQL